MASRDIACFASHGQFSSIASSTGSTVVYNECTVPEIVFQTFKITG